MKRGIYTDIGIEAYHAGPGISKSGLDDLHRSPAFFHAHHRSPLRPVRSETTSQLHGNLAHCAILEPHAFDDRYVVGPSVNRNTKAWKDFVDGTMLIPIQADQRDVAMQQRDSVYALPNVFGKMTGKRVFSRGQAEVSAYWNDRENGVLCRARPDYWFPVNDREAVVVDVKTVGDARSFEFSRQCAKLRYHVQDGMYSEGIAMAAGLEVVAFIFVVVETAWPYAAASYQLGEQSRLEGFNEFRRLVDLYAECDSTDTWPGYAEQTSVIDLPPYALTPQELEITFV